MTKKEIYQLFVTMQAFYADPFRDLSDEAAQLKIALWQEQFANDPADKVLAAVKAFASSDVRGYPPTPGQIKLKMKALSEKQDPDEQQAWAAVTKAVSNGLYGFQEEYAKLPESIQRAIGSANVLREWAAIDTQEFQTVTASNFKRDYRAVIAQREDQRCVSQYVRGIGSGEDKPLIGDI